MDTFSTVRFKIKVANRFRKFSIQLARTHTEALESMLDFFEVHELSPMDSIDGSLSAIEIRIKKRIGNAIAIIRDIEKSQTLPTVAMLQSLFEQQFEEEHDNEFLDDDFEFIETKFEDVERGEAWEEETTIPKIRYDRLEEKMEGLKADFSHVLSKVKEVKHSFGKDYLKLELTLEEIEKYKRSIKNA
ncbi:BfmA/BtgA family mobilization protein [Thalassobellus citreus]|uniref:BfmA/BtgA family mobilization protein n=1 Tax=Thalassobellus citreus TaxID=3367752 RepID=UPI0037B9BC1C